MKNRKLVVTAFFITLGALGISSCATERPDRVPEVDAGSLPALELKGLKNRNVTLKVVNERAVNKTAGNTHEVEKYLHGVFTDSMARGNLKIADSAENHLIVVANDCKDAPAGTECVYLTAELKSPRMHLEVGSQFWHGYSRSNNIYSFGDISAAYTGAIRSVIDSLEAQFAKLQKKNQK